VLGPATSPACREGSALLFLRVSCGHVAVDDCAAFPDGSGRQLEDSEARELADRLWEMAHGARTAVVAAAIQHERNRGTDLNHPIRVPEASADHVKEAPAWQ